MRVIYTKKNVGLQRWPWCITFEAVTLLSSGSVLFGKGFSHHQHSPLLITMLKIAVIGAGAAGFFAAIHAAEAHVSNQVTLLEKTSKTLAKVRVSGGGRCNVCHHCFEVAELAAHYPRGQKFLKRAFRHFQTPETIAWFEKRGVQLKAEPDGRMFPVTDSSETIARCLEQEARNLNVNLRLNTDVQALKPTSGGWQLTFKNGSAEQFDRIIVTAGGSPKPEGLQWLAKLGLKVVAPVPSLFTFNMPNQHTADLMGLTVPQVKARIAGSKLQSNGPLLFTHWGMSGPAILKLSAWGAREFYEKQYRFTLLVQWLPDHTEAMLRDELAAFRQQLPKRKLVNRNPFGLPNRLWEFLLQKYEIDGEQEWGQLSKKAANLLLHSLLQDAYAVNGKTTFKEEFVTCGGISLDQLNVNTLEAQQLPGLFFAGELLDIDGVTGGFNFQAAWTTAFLAGTAAGTPSE